MNTKEIIKSLQMVINDCYSWENWDTNDSHNFHSMATQLEKVIKHLEIDINIKVSDPSIKYYKTEILQCIGEYEDRHTLLVSIPADKDPCEKAIELAMEQRGSDKSNYDKGMDAFFFGDGVIFVPTLIEISKEDFNFINKALKILKC